MFFDRFSDLCTNIGKTPTGVGREIGISKATVSYWKQGNTPKPDALSKIAQYFDVSVDYLIGKTDIKSPQPTSEDDEMLVLLDELRNRPEMKMLFSVSKNCTPEEVQQAVKIIEALRKDTNNE